MDKIENLKQQILGLIECIYSAVFTHPLELTVNDILDSDYKQYIVKLYIHDHKWNPLVIATECKSDDEFLLFIAEELRSRNLIRSDHYKIQLYESN